MFYVAWYIKHFEAQHKAYLPNALVIYTIYTHRPKIMQHTTGCAAVIICSHAPCGNWSTDSRDAMGRDWQTAGWSQKTTFSLQSNSTEGLLALSVWLAGCREQLNSKQTDLSKHWYWDYSHCMVTMVLWNCQNVPLCRHFISCYKRG